MEYAKVVSSRRMVRRFDPDRPVDPAALGRVLRDAVRAPSAGFSQGWDFLVLRSPDERAAFWATTTDPDEPPDAWLTGVRDAPVLVVCCSDRSAYLRRYAEPDKPWQDQDESHWPVPYWDIDTGMAAMLMLLTAVDQGLGGLFFGVPAEFHDDLMRALAIPSDRNVVGVVAIGYARPNGVPGSPRRRPRRPLDQVVHDGRFGRPWRSAP